MYRSEEAVEFAELEIFLRRNEDYKPPELDGPALVARPIGVPGAYEPLQMFPKHAPSRSPSPSPLKLREKEKGEIDASDQLGEFGLEGVSVSADDLRALVEELGLSWMVVQLIATARKVFVRYESYCVKLKR